MRVIVVNVLTDDCGWSDEEAKRLSRNVSHHYDNHIRKPERGKAPKDSYGLAFYDESDIPGLIQAANSIKTNNPKKDSYSKPTKFEGTSLDEMGY